MMQKSFLLCLMFLFIITPCGREYTPEELEYIKVMEDYRTEKDSIMEFADYSPFNRKGKVEFHPLKYFPVNPDFKFKSKLFEFEEKDTVTVYGTKGDERKNVRFGYVKFDFDNEEYKMNIYEGTASDSSKYYMCWFTDKTTNEESYGVGRYLNFKKSDDASYVYTIDFNYAFNPYCAYSKDYSCTIPLREDYIDLAIEAGEKKFHD